MLQLSDEDFQVMLRYMLDSKGAMRKRTSEQAESIVSSWDNREDGVKQMDSSVKVLDKITDGVYQRARDIVQTLI